MFNVRQVTYMFNVRQAMWQTYNLPHPEILKQLNSNRGYSFVVYMMKLKKIIFFWYINCPGLVSIKLVYGVYKCISMS